MPHSIDPRQPANFQRGTACAEFLEALESAPPGSRGVVFDVGANNGAWSASWRPHIERFREVHNKTIDLVFFEPQAVFATRLHSLAQRLNATFVPAAAWSSDTYLHISDGHGSVAATVRPVSRHGDDETGAGGPAPSPDASTVRAVDLAAYVTRTLPRTGAAQELSLMKLDVEGAGTHTHACAIHTYNTRAQPLTSSCVRFPVRLDAFSCKSTRLYRDAPCCLLTPSGRSSPPVDPRGPPQSMHSFRGC